MLRSRRVDFKFSLMIYVGVIGPNGSEKTSLVNPLIVLNFGEKLAEGNPEEVMAKPEVREACLGSEGERC
jgi:ABC-type branched-subunit amino acid transport system ATPase component